MHKPTTTKLRETTPDGSGHRSTGQLTFEVRNLLMKVYVWANYFRWKDVSMVVLDVYESIIFFIGFMQNRDVRTF